MDIKEYENIIEAILFASGEAVPCKKLCEVLSLEEKELKSIIENMADKNRGVMIKEIDKGYQMCSNPEYYDFIRKVMDKQDNRTLSQAAYETLAVIAYNKTATRAKIESVRGVNSGSSIMTLLDNGLIEEAGRIDAPGRPVIYSTSQEFLRACSS